MKVPSSRLGIKKTRIEMLPLIDVVFLLLVGTDLQVAHVQWKARRPLSHLTSTHGLRDGAVSSAAWHLICRIALAPLDLPQGKPDRGTCSRRSAAMSVLPAHSRQSTATI